MVELTQADLDRLDDLAWDWNPIGVPRTEFTLGEYDCIVEAVVPLLRRGEGIAGIVAHFDRFFPEHFGLPNQRGCGEFAVAAVEWWRRIQQIED